MRKRMQSPSHDLLGGYVCPPPTNCNYDNYLPQLFRLIAFQNSGLLSQACHVTYNFGSENVINSSVQQGKLRWVYEPSLQRRKRPSD